MIRIALALLLVATTATAGDVVDAARTSKQQRKKSTTRVITNADVKKSKGKLGVTSATAKPADAAPTQSLVEKYEADKKAKALASGRLDSAQKSVAALEKELAAIEQAYYEEDDLQKRDNEIVRNFNDIKKKLDAAREELARLTDTAPIE